MIRATFIAVSLGICALSSEAQNPTPAPTPPTPDATPSVAQPTPAPRPKRATVPPPEWPSVDLSDLESRLDDLKSMQMDMDLVGPGHLKIDPSFDPDMDFAYTPRPGEFEMPDMPDMPDIPDMPDMPDVMMYMPAIPDVPAMPSIPDIMATPAIPALPSIAPMAIEPMMMEMDAMPPLAPMAPMDLAPPASMDVTLIPPMTYSISMAPRAARAAAGSADAAIARIQGQSPFERQFGGITSDPPKAWAQADPADSLYRLAREALNRGEYRRAASLFGDITKKFPNSVYASDARYWQAFALYRLGSPTDLHDALNALQDSGRSYRQASLQTDAPVLATRIRGALAAQGDASAKKYVSDAAAQPGGACDREDLAVRAEALNSLARTDPESTTPILARLLARRDDCSASLRRTAIYLLGRRTDAEAMNLIIGAARNDPDIRVRGEALRFLAAMPGDQAIATIEEMARTPGNEQLQSAAISALGRSDNPRAKQSLRAIIERNDLSENLRIAALSSIDSEHSPDNGAYIRAAYPRLETPRLKVAALRAVSRVGGNENDQWLLTVVRNPNEPVEVRAMALRYAGRSTIPIGDLTRMYDVAGDRPLRQQLIVLYAERPEPEATDKLLDIAKTGTDPDLRRYAISALARKNDPRTKKLLVEIIDKND